MTKLILRMAGALTVYQPSMLIKCLQWLLWMAVVRYRPIDDDLERAFCTQREHATPYGHYYCGWYESVARPRIAWKGE